MTEKINLFDEAASSWDEKPGRIELAKKLFNTIKKRVQISPEMRVMEYGCGTGLVSVMMAEEVKELTAVDSSEGMIKVLSKKVEDLQLDNVRPSQADLRSEASPSTDLDLIYSSMVMHHIPETELLLDKFQSLLKDGGKLIIVDLDEEDGDFHKGSEPVPHSGFNQAELKAKMKASGFKTVDSEIVHIMNKEVEEGKEKDFPIFMMLATK
jgi:ubiquinone/menaquinone biosynthesis C-methylase UbiE